MWSEMENIRYGRQMREAQRVEVMAGQASGIRDIQLLDLLQWFSLPTYKYHSVDPREHV